jgi:phosphopentomutase
LARALLIVLDSFGCGGAVDAADFGDEGADTFGHIVEACARGDANRDGLRAGPLKIPFMESLGVAFAAGESTGRSLPGISRPSATAGAYGYGVEVSKGKDTPSGHWEIAGAPLDFDWGYFPDTTPAFPADLMRAIIEQGKLPGILGDCRAAGTAIIDVLGDEHLRTGKPILYTSADSVLQIAAHEEAFGLERLYNLCALTRKLVDPLRIGRVIARPFAGARAGEFHRTPNRKDFAMPPPRGNLLDRASEARRAVISIGKIGDIFCHRNTGEEIKGDRHPDLFAKMLRAFETLPDGGLIFGNFLDLDTDFGHRRDVAGAAACIEDFDERLAGVFKLLKPGDLALVTGDHGNDPTWRGTDHTREHVPILAFGPDVRQGSIGRRDTFADIGATIAAHLGLAPTLKGRPFW